MKTANIFTLILICLFCCFLTACSQQKHNKRLHMPFQLEWLANKPDVNPFVFPAKKNLLIEFISESCKTCIKMLPVIKQLQAESQEQLMVITVLTPIGAENVLSSKRFIKKYHISFPVLFDRNTSMLSHFRIPGWPTFLAVDRDGMIVERLYGLQNLASLQKVRY